MSGSIPLCIFFIVVFHLAVSQDEFTASYCVYFPSTAQNCEDEGGALCENIFKHNSASEFSTEETTRGSSVGTTEASTRNTDSEYTAENSKDIQDSTTADFSEITSNAFTSTASESETSTIKNTQSFVTFSA